MKAIPKRRRGNQVKNLLSGISEDQKNFLYSMENFCCYYFLNPLKPGLRIADTDIPDVSVKVRNPLSDKKLIIEYFFYGSDRKIISHFRVVFPDFLKKTLNEEELDILHSIKESILGALRLTYSPFVTLYPLSLSTTGHIDMIPDFYEVFVVQEFSLEQLKNTTVCAILSPDDFVLFTDSYARYYPLTHRYLSLFKLFDKYAHNNKKKTTDLLVKYLSKYSEDYKKLGISRQNIENFAFSIRDKCAHAVLSNGKRGARAFIRNNMVEIESFMENIMQRAAVDLINDQFKQDVSGVKIHWVAPPGFKENNREGGE